MSFSRLSKRSLVSLDRFLYRWRRAGRHSSWRLWALRLQGFVSVIISLYLSATRRIISWAVTWPEFWFCPVTKRPSLSTTVCVANKSFLAVLASNLRPQPGGAFRVKRREINFQFLDLLIRHAGHFPACN